MRLLLVEDERSVRVTVRDALEEAGYEIVATGDGSEALRAIEGTLFDIVLTDVRLPGATGIEIFRRLREKQPGTAILLMTAFADTDDAVAVMREGARDYITKPFEMDELLLRLGRVRQEVEFHKQMEDGRHPEAAAQAHTIRGTSPSARRLIDRVAAAAATDVHVLITGETGTGKDLCARLVHQGSRRAGQPFVAVNCAAIPESLLESELFGHELGAFTGAIRRRVGRFEAAQGGTLFLDEIGDLSLGSQGKLLRVLETSAFEALGSSRSVRADVRIIAATNRDLAKAIERGEFRKDLFYRLNVIDIEAPPLRERRGDIGPLVRDFLEEIAARQGCAVPTLDPCAIAALATHDYPGNVRELIHALERAVALASKGVIRVEHLPKDMTAVTPCECAADPTLPACDVEPLASAVAQFERHYVQRVLGKVGGRRGQAARALGISRKNLWLRLREGRE